MILFEVIIGVFFILIATSMTKKARNLTKYLFIGFKTVKQISGEEKGSAIVTLFVIVPLIIGIIFLISGLFELHLITYN